MSHEAQALIPQRRSLSSQLIYDELNNNLFNTINILGAVNGSVTSYYSITCKGCDDTSCLSDANRTGLYAGLSAAYALCFFNLTRILIKKFYPANIHCLESINNVFNKFIQILNSNIFYIYSGSALAAAIEHSCTIPDWQFWAYVFNAALILTALSVLSRIPARINKILDMFIAFLEGGSTMIGTLSSIAQINDSIHKLHYLSPNSWVYSTAGMATRYSLGGVWGLFQSGLRYYYPSYISEDDIVKSRWPSILQTLLNTITLCILTGFAIANTNSFDLKIIFSLCAALIFISLILSGKGIATGLSQNFNQSQDNQTTSGSPTVVDITEGVNSADKILVLSEPPQEYKSSTQTILQNTAHPDQDQDKTQGQNQIIVQQKNNLANSFYQKASRLLLGKILFYKSQPDAMTIINKHPQDTVKKDIFRENNHVGNYAENP
jgi:hypothetical protein